tara:strand:- start:190 stop:1527 length:1338 start_codon:yes stop_codon:yes gene_type:complete
MATKRARGGERSSKQSDYYNGEDKLLGNYQYISIEDIINNFTAVYVGENKILANVLDGDITYHAHRALQELSYDTLKSCKTQEIKLPPSLQMPLPHDYVNYTKMTWSDANGIEHVIYPTSKTGNHNTIQQDEEGNYKLAKVAGGATQGPVGLMQDNNGAFEEHANNYLLENGYGTLFIGGVSNELTASYSGPFRLKANYEFYNGSGVNESSEDTSEPFLKDGMQIFSLGMQPNTTVTNVTRVAKPGIDKFTTEFYLSKPTYSTQEVHPHATTAGGGNTIKYVSFDDITKNTTWGKYKGSSSHSTGVTSTHTNPSVDHDHYFDNTGQRRGLDPQYAQSNGSFFINHSNGKIHFSSDLSGKTIILHYLSDHHAENGEAIVHKFAEEAMYKWIAYGCSQARTDVPPAIVQRLKQERSAETRKAKIRLSNIKIEEISQIMRGKSKFLDH